ncbi:DUF3392 domain-containing protein [Neiella litorisoli]|uniref:DUF3392 domain-containing protein n=1 Tax=Neiella litorisoli TaxID=2771431 RepID=UPI0034E27FB7
MASLSSWLYGELHSISTALVACLIVVLGSDINQLLRKTMRRHHFVVRTSVFILINAFGFGLAIVKLSPVVAGQLAQLSPAWLCGLLIGCFIFIGCWAQRNRHV